MKVSINVEKSLDKQRKKYARFFKKLKKNKQKVITYSVIAVGVLVISIYGYITLEKNRTEKESLFAANTIFQDISKDWNILALYPNISEEYLGEIEWNIIDKQLSPLKKETGPLKVQKLKRSKLEKLKKNGEKYYKISYTNTRDYKNKTVTLKVILIQENDSWKIQHFNVN